MKSKSGNITVFTGKEPELTLGGKDAKYPDGYCILRQRPGGSKYELWIKQEDFPDLINALCGMVDEFKKVKK